MSSTLSSAVSLPPDVSHGYQFIAVQWSLVSVAIITVFLRFCIRGLLQKKIGANDYTILAALACALAQSILAIFQVQSGFGRNIQYLHPNQIKDITMNSFISIIFNLTGTFLVRISVCLFILQLLPFTQRFFRWFTYGLMVFFTLIAIAAVLTICFQCIPVRGIWDRTIDAHCTSAAVTTKISRAEGGFAVFMDILCVLLPIMVFGKLNIGWRDKVAVFILLGFGLVTAGAAVARTVLYDFESDNPTWDLVSEGIWACVEQNIGIIVASMPALRQPFTMLKKKRRLQHSRSSDTPFAGGKPFLASPLRPPTEYTQTDQTTSPNSFVSTFTEKMEAEQRVDSGIKTKIATSIASKFDRQSFSADRVNGDKDHQSAKATECHKKWEEIHGSGPTLGNPAVLGYSFEIMGGSPRRTT